MVAAAAAAIYALQAMINDKHCFELYGFDVIVDSNLQPWLIEVRRHGRNGCSKGSADRPAMLLSRSQAGGSCWPHSTIA